MSIHTIGVIGAGKLGITLTQLARHAGYDVVISGSGDPAKIALSVDVLTPGALAATTEDVARRADLLILAMPLGKFRDLPAHMFHSKLIIDATNYWWEVDGPRSDILPDTQSSSEAIRAFFDGSRVVKALNHMGYHDLHDEAKPVDSPNRKAIAIAGNSSTDIRTVADFINTLGFDPLLLGSLASGVVLEPGYPAFGANLARDELQTLIALSHKREEPAL